MANQELTWLVSKFVVETPGVTHALVLSADGIPMASSDRLTQDASDRLAAVASGLVGLANGVSGPFGAGRVSQVVIELEGAFIFVTGISDGSSLAVVSRPDSDVGLVAYEMAVLVDRAGAVLTPALRAADRRASAA